ncbi:LuxR family two component transcriptional regulator [Glaciihabitans tibetensis]|uniref:LuxR family two component transcriptional regulator n=1 Tax=Glaciihabitans tibetensis TaxID=1266600 RepID=A0A2T0VA59_9MICO|nr:response regulator transcription factor [Glaciihabitans tibetensis]PRY67079.1 LuxR family two component transcriptional regulator [Glaciihabitans tibetensis]
MNATTRVAVVDDHELVAIGVRNLIESAEGLVFARHATSVAELVRPMRDAELVVLDLSLRDGIHPEENVRQIREWGANVLVLTSGEDPYLVRNASRAEVLGIVRKSTPREALVEALRTAARGDLVPTTEWASALDSDPLLDGAPLTAREREVLSLYASGLGARDVAEMLFISENTVNDHLRRIRSVYHQIGRPATTKVELYQRGIEDGFVQAPRRG